MPSPPDTVWNLLTATAGLLAFLLGFFTLIGRERKAPYIINNVLFIFIVAIAGVIFDLLSLLDLRGSGAGLRLAGLIALIGAVSLSLFQTYRVFIRLTYFVDHISWKQLPLIRWARRQLGKLQARQSYEHDPLPFPQDFAPRLAKLLTDTAKLTPPDDHHRSLAVRAKHVAGATDLLIELVLLFLKENLSVQYLTASRHPADFYARLKSRAAETGLQWDQLKPRFIVIDAYTPHFGYLDSIYPKRTEGLQRDGVTCVTSSMSFAGIHSASGRAFNVLKKRAGRGAQRAPFLVIYEDPYALSDLESAEQYRVFVRHVLPSERQFASMYTVVVESSIEERDWRLLTSYADISLDLPTTPEAGT